MCWLVSLQAEHVFGPLGTKLLEAAQLSILPYLLLEGEGLGCQGGFLGEMWPPWETRPVSSGAGGG